MASPTYHTANGQPVRTAGGPHRQWGIAFGSGAMLGGNTPPYLGQAKAEPEPGGSLFCDRTPVYLTPPPPTATTKPSMTTSSATAPQPATAAAPQPATVAVVAPRP